MHAAEPAGSYSTDPGTNEVLKWVGTRIAVGDEISLKFVETAPVQTPGDGRDARPHPRSEG